LKNRLSLLTARERQVLRMLVAGEADKQIASKIGISRRAVAFHRARILETMAIPSVVELAASLARADISS
jgi:two-component system response regulator DctR